MLLQHYMNNDAEAKKRAPKGKIGHMTQQEMKRLGRVELLEIIVMQSDELEAVKKEREALSEENAALKERLNKRELSMHSAGNLAEASLAVTNIFEEAEKAASIYKENVERMSRERGDALPTEAVYSLPEFLKPIQTDEVEAAKREAERIVEEAKAKARTLLLESERYSRKKRQEADAYRAEMSEKLEAFYTAHEGLKELLERRSE